MANLEYLKNLYTLFVSSKPRKEEVEFSVTNVTAVTGKNKSKAEGPHLDGSIVTTQVFR